MAQEGLERPTPHFPSPLAEPAEPKKHLFFIPQLPDTTQSSRWPQTPAREHSLQEEHSWLPHLWVRAGYRAAFANHASSFAGSVDPFNAFWWSCVQTQQFCFVFINKKWIQCVCVRMVFFHCTHRFFIPTSAIPVNRGFLQTYPVPPLEHTSGPWEVGPGPLDTLKLHLLLPGPRESETSRSNTPLVPTSSALMLTGTWWETPKQKYSFVPWALSDWAPPCPEDTTT